MRAHTKRTTYRPPDIGSFTERITIQQATETQGDRGGIETVFTDYTTCWAQVRYPARQGQEGISADQQVVVTPVEFYILDRPDIAENWRILHKGEYYDIINLKRPFGRFGPLVLVGQKLSSDNA